MALPEAFGAGYEFLSKDDKASLARMVLAFTEARSKDPESPLYQYAAQTFRNRLGSLSRPAQAVVRSSPEGYFGREEMRGELAGVIKRFLEREGRTA